MIFADATRSGVIEEQERAMLSGIMRLADRPVRELMTPRTELDWIDRRATEAESMRPRSPNRRIRCCRSPTARPTGARRGQGARSAGAALAGRRGARPDPQGRGRARPARRDGRAAHAAAIGRRHGDGPRRIRPSRRASSPRPTCWRRSPATSPATRTRATSRWWSSATTVRCWFRARMPADALAERLGIDLPEDREFATAAGYVLFGAQAAAARGRELHRSGLALRGGRHGRAQDRQAAGEQGCRSFPSEPPPRASLGPGCY
jgi:putative hemolysin